MAKITEYPKFDNIGDNSVEFLAEAYGPGFDGGDTVRVDINTVADYILSRIQTPSSGLEDRVERLEHRIDILENQTDSDLGGYVKVQDPPSPYGYDSANFVVQDVSNETYYLASYEDLKRKLGWDLGITG